MYLLYNALSYSLRIHVWMARLSGMSHLAINQDDSRPRSKPGRNKVSPRVAILTKTKTKTKLITIRFTRTRTRIFKLEEKRKLNEIKI